MASVSKFNFSGKTNFRDVASRVFSNLRNGIHVVRSNMPAYADNVRTWLSDTLFNEPDVRTRAARAGLDPVEYRAGLAGMGVGEYIARRAYTTACLSPLFLFKDPEEARNSAVTFAQATLEDCCAMLAERHGCSVERYTEVADDMIRKSMGRAWGSAGRRVLDDWGVEATGAPDAGIHVDVESDEPVKEDTVSVTGSIGDGSTSVKYDVGHDEPAPNVDSDEVEDVIDATYVEDVEVEPETFDEVVNPQNNDEPSGLGGIEKDEYIFDAGFWSNRGDGIVECPVAVGVSDQVIEACIEADAKDVSGETDGGEVRIKNDANVVIDLAATSAWPEESRTRCEIPLSDIIVRTDDTVGLRVSEDALPKEFKSTYVGDAPSNKIRVVVCDCDPYSEEVLGHIPLVKLSDGVSGLAGIFIKEGAGFDVVDKSFGGVDGTMVVDASPETPVEIFGYNSVPTGRDNATMSDVKVVYDVCAHLDDAMKQREEAGRETSVSRNEHRGSRKPAHMAEPLGDDVVELSVSDIVRDPKNLTHMRMDTRVDGYLLSLSVPASQIEVNRRLGLAKMANNADVTLSMGETSISGKGHEWRECAFDLLDSVEAYTRETRKLDPVAVSSPDFLEGLEEPEINC